MLNTCIEGHILIKKYSKSSPSVTGGQGNANQRKDLVRYHIYKFFTAKYKNLSFI